MENASEKITRDQLLWREFLAALLLLLTLLWGALLFPAPLSSPAETPIPLGIPARAPWIFLAVQVMLFHLPPLWGGLLIPAAFLGFLVLLPWEPRLPYGPRITLVSFTLLIMAWVALTLYGSLRGL